MTKAGKKYTDAAKLIEAGKAYTPKEAVELVKRLPSPNSTALLNAPFASVSIRSMLTNRSAVLWFCPMVLVNPRLFLFLPAVQKLRKLRMQVLTLLVLKSSLTRSKAAGSTLTSA